MSVTSSSQGLAERIKQQKGSKGRRNYQVWGAKQKTQMTLQGRGMPVRVIEDLEAIEAKEEEPDLQERTELLDP